MKGKAANVLSFFNEVIVRKGIPLMTGIRLQNWQ